MLSVLLSHPGLNQHPVANAGADIVVTLPTRSAEVDGSKSTDDERIVSYEWTRDRKSPAAGVCLNRSLPFKTNSFLSNW